MCVGLCRETTTTPRRCRRRCPFSPQMAQWVRCAHHQQQQEGHLLSNRLRAATTPLGRVQSEFEGDEYGIPPPLFAPTTNRRTVGNHGMYVYVYAICLCMYER